MRLAIIALALLILATPSSAQPSPCYPQSSAPAFDPYKPSDLVIARNYVGTVLAQARLGVLLELDPYVPFEGELLRQLGRATPVWAHTGYPWYPPAPQSSPCVAVPERAMPQQTSSNKAPLTTLEETLTMLSPRAAVATVRSTPTPSQRVQGITVEWEGRRWVSAGPAVPFSETEFVRAGERGQSPVFRRAGARDNVIYIRTTPGMVAPFRASP